uniref:Probable isoaspartyl peptidase/L-asparaginase 3 n=1 Tax=Nicotiana sylvestris TaxID=4096 RepID=A0A1U7VK16_NICSY|nr:PREDICTED: probable isoaspartyl peptidase/L-asparaginase 3 [Nicotiana sylvestris]
MKKQLQVPHLLLFSMVLASEIGSTLEYPVVISTWPFLEAVRAAWRAVDSGFSAVDAVVEGCSACEKLRCDGTGVYEVIPSKSSN